MDDDLFLFLEPGIHRVPVEGDIAAQVGPVLLAVRVLPGGVLGYLVPRFDVPVNGSPLITGFCRVVRLLQQVHADVFFGEIVDQRVADIHQQHGVFAVGNGHATQFGPNPASGRFEFPASLCHYVSPHFQYPR